MVCAIDSEENIIEFKNVSYSYGKENKCLVLSNLNFSVRRGEILGIVGVNGCGKSTFAKLCDGLYIPTQGDVIINGMNTKDDSNYPKIFQNVGMVFQNPEEQIVYSTVEEEVAFGLENLSVDRKHMQDRIHKALNAVGLNGFESRNIETLSGGQKQRLVIASVLAMNPKVMVFDEATSMLDPVGRNNITNIIKKLNEEYGVTIIFITHYIEELFFADRVAMFTSGEILDVGTPREVLTNIELLSEANLLPLDSTRLLNYFKSIGYDINLKKSLIDFECARELVKVLEL